MLQIFATITTDANELLAPIQDRMRVVNERADWPVWLGEPKTLRGRRPLLDLPAFFHATR